MAVTGAQGDLVEAVEHVELGDRERVEAVHAHRVAHHHRVVPAAPARAPGRGAVLAAALAQQVALGAVQLRRQRSLADAGRVGLGDAEDRADGARADAEAGADAADRRARRRDEGVGAVIDVELRPLGALEQHALAPLERPREEHRRVADPAREPARGRAHLGVQRPPVGRRAPQRLVPGRHVRADRPREGAVLRRVGEVGHPDAAAPDLVLVGGPDAPRGGADALVAAARLGVRLEVAMVGQDDVGPVADEQAVADVDALAGEGVDLREQRRRVDHHPVADDAAHPRVQDAGGQEVEDELGLAHPHGVTGVVAALITRHDGGAGGEEVDDLALALVAPLRTDDGDVHALPRPV